jgi:hypothetical protein
VGEDGAGTAQQEAPAIFHAASGPIATDVDQNVVGLGLTVETRSRCAQGRVTTVFSAVSENVGDVGGGARQDNNLRHESIWAGVRGISDQINNAMQDLFVA